MYLSKLSVFIIFSCAFLRKSVGDEVSPNDEGATMTVENGNPFSQSSNEYEDSESSTMKVEASVDDTDSFDISQQDEMYTLLQDTDENLVDKDALTGVQAQEKDAQTRNLYNLHKRFMFLNLKLSLNVNMEGGARRRYELTLPIPQILAVMDAFVQAAFSLKDAYPNSRNPFNLSLRYKDGGCLQVEKAFGLKTDENHAWIINISGYQGKEVYRGLCLPNRHEVKVGPFYEIALIYTSLNDTQL